MTSWNPDRYHQFAAQRTAPFHDLVGLLTPTPGGDVVDLGCGSGELTAGLVGTLGARSVIGYDTSEAMLQRAEAHRSGSVEFRHGDLANFGPPHHVDVIVSNAALQWVDDHVAVLTQWRRALRPGGQMAVQVPANADHPSHRVAQEVAAESPFVDELAGSAPPDPSGGVLAPERYSELLHHLGFTDQHVRLQVYGHELVDTAAVVDWVDGTTLNRFRAVLPTSLHDQFVERYRTRLMAELGERSPYFYAFKRILMWGRLGSVVSAER